MSGEIKLTQEDVGADDKSRGLSTATWWLLTAIAVAVAIYLTLNSTRTALTEIANQIIQDNLPGSALTVDHISIPLWTAIPFADTVGLVPSEYEGYFSFKNSSGEALSGSCEASTADFTVRQIGGDRIAMHIDGTSMLTLANCS